MKRFRDSGVAKSAVSTITGMLFIAFLGIAQSVSASVFAEVVPSTLDRILPLPTEEAYPPATGTADTSAPIVFVDTAIADYPILLKGISPAARIYLLDGTDDGVVQMAGILAGQSEIESLYVFSHGAQGQIHLGNARLDVRSLEGRYRNAFVTIGQAVGEGADIHFFACNAGRGSDGRELAESLARITRADVALSDDPTGDPLLGGDWQLETVTGPVADKSILSASARGGYRHLLATYDFEGASGSGTYTVTTTVSGVTLTVTDPYSTFWLGDGGGFAGTSGTLLVGGQLTTNLTTFSFSSPVNLTTFRFACQGTVNNYTFTPVGGSGNSPVNVTSSTSGADMNVNWNGITSFTVTENGDDGIFTDTVFDTFVFTAANSAPTIGGTSAGQTVNDNATLSPFSAVTISDADGDNVTTTVTLDTNAKGVFTSASLSASGFTGSGPYTLASTTPSNAQTAIRQLVFDPTNNRVVPGSTETTTFTITANDGSVDGTDNATTVVSTSINDAPVITSNGGGASASVNINENTTAVTTVASTDVDTGETYTYSISGGLDDTRFNINSSNGALTFAVAPNYESPLDNGADNVYNVQVTVTDSGTGNLTDVQDLAVTVNNVNENPIIVSDGGGSSASINAAENQTAVTTVSATDQDTGDSLTYSLTGGADQARFNINSANGTLTFAVAPNYESPVDSGTNGVYDVQVTVTDDGAGTLTDVQNIAVTVTNANEAPVITSNGGGASASVNINENTTAVTTVNASDVDTADSLTYSISGGADAARFSINSSNGALTFAVAPNYESPTDSGANNVYDVQVTATDDGTGNLTDTQNIAVTVNNVNENPIIVSDGGGSSASINAAENQTAVTTVSATDQDTGDSLTYSLTGGADQARFNINSANGTLTFAVAPNYESPVDSGTNGVYDVQVTVTDDGAGTLTDVQNIAVTVTNANEAPVITSNGGGASASVNINENTTAVTTVNASDVDTADSLTYSISGGADAARFSINSSNGALTFASAPSYESPTDSGANNVYDVQVMATDDGTGNLTDTQNIAVTVNNVNENPIIVSDGGGSSASINAAENQTAVTTVTATDQDTGDSLTYSLTGGADQARFNINSANGTLTFAVAPNYESPVDSGTNGVYDVQVTVTDDGAGTLTDVQNIAVTVTNANEAPVITSNGGGASAGISVDEKSTAVTTVTATDVDSGSVLSYSISGGADAARFSINSSSGALTFGSAPNYESPTDSGANNVYEVQVMATDNGTGNLTDTQTINVTVSDINDNPTITSSAITSVNEDALYSYTFSVNDEDTGETLTLSAPTLPAWLSFNNGTGLLSGTPTNAEVGDHSVLLRVNDGTVDVDQGFTVSVANTNDAPVVSGTPVTRAVEGVAYSFTISASDVDTGDTLSYVMANNPAWLSINSASGLVSGTPGTSDAGNSTGILAGANDGTTTTYLSAFAIQVVGDLDGDGDGDDVDTDIDGDGMSNAYEDANGLDKLDASDRNSDLDGDGVSNYEEFVADTDATVDDYPPAITQPNDMTVDATGLFTEVDIGTAIATDGLDGAVAVTADAGGYFTPGTHVVTWTATDAAGNSDTALQVVNVRPLVELSKDQNTTEGAAATFKVLLNGPAVVYPVVVPYTLSGTADASDHDLAAGNVTITASNLEATVSVNLLDDGPGEGMETLIVTLSTPANAVLGPKSTHRLSIHEDNLAPSVSLSATQGGTATRLIAQGGANVVVTAGVSDPNTGDSHSYDWSATDSALVDLDSADDTFTFDPATAGTFTLGVTVTDSGVGSLTDSARLALQVVSALPSLTAVDTDEDGVDDDVEGTGDADGDGVPDYLDSLNLQRNVLQELPATADEFVIETEPGLTLQLGGVAFRADSGGADVTESEIQTYGNEGAGAVADSEYTYAGGIFDFSVNDLPVAGQSVNIVLPQQSAVPANAVYRKLMSFGWTDFIEDANNRLMSAAGAAGYCPPPGDAAYGSGLTAGHWCVQLTIEDGGANDTDGEVNRRVQDPGGVATAVPATPTPPSGGGGGGGGALDPWGLLLLLLALVPGCYTARQRVACRYRRPRVGKRERSVTPFDH